MRARSACRPHRDDLIAFVDRREVGERTASALRHLDACDACRRELEATALAIAGLRRLHAEALSAEPPNDAWPRLRRRVVAGRAPTWRWRSAMAGSLVGAWLIGVLVAPTAYRPRVDAFQEVGVDAGSLIALGAHEERVETLRFHELRRERGHAAETAAAAADERAPEPPDWAGPDGLGVPGTPAPAEPPGIRTD